MGLFDTIIVKKGDPVKCPKCRGKLGNFQTKALENLLDEYTEGKASRRVCQYKMAARPGGSKIPLMVPDENTWRTEPHPKYHRFEAYDFCKECEVMVLQDFQFDAKGKLARHGRPRVEKSK